MKVGDYFSPWAISRGLIIPDWLSPRTEVTPGAKMVYSALVRYGGQNGEAWPGQDRLASDLGMGLRSVMRHIAELEAHGLIVVEQRGLKQTNLYRFLWHAWAEAAAGSDNVASHDMPNWRDKRRKIGGSYHEEEKEEAGERAGARGHRSRDPVWRNQPAARGAIGREALKRDAEKNDPAAAEMLALAARYYGGNPTANELAQFAEEMAAAAGRSLEERQAAIDDARQAAAVKNNGGNPRGLGWLRVSLRDYVNPNSAAEDDAPVARARLATPKEEAEMKRFMKAHREEQEARRNARRKEATQ